ncbi:MAG: hypothetical protein WKG03_02760 [Telluria sp.]
MPLSPPPRDDLGNVKPHDHPDILEDDGVIRRISSQWVVSDPKANGGRRISTAAFEPSSMENGAGLSVDLERAITDAGLDPHTHVTTPRWIASVKLSARQFRNLGLIVGYSPIDESPNEMANLYHGEVWGIKTRSQKKALLNNCNWFVPIENCALGEEK